MSLAQRVPWTHNQFFGKRLNIRIINYKIKWNLSLSSPQLADIFVVLTVFVDAGVRVSGGREGVDYGVGSVLTGSRSAGEREDATDSEWRGTGSWGWSSQTGALRTSVASPVETASTNTRVIRELYYVENWGRCPREKARFWQILSLLRWGWNFQGGKIHILWVD